MATAGNSPIGGICMKNLKYNFVLVSAEHGNMYGLKPPKHNQIFPSIATHALVNFLKTEKSYDLF